MKHVRSKPYQSIRNALHLREELRREFGSTLNKESIFEFVEPEGSSEEEEDGSSGKVKELRKKKMEMKKLRKKLEEQAKKSKLSYSKLI